MSLLLFTVLVLGKRLELNLIHLSPLFYYTKTNTGVHSSPFTVQSLQRDTYTVGYTPNHVVVALKEGHTVTYDQAHELCREGGGYIASITSSEEDKQILEQMGAFGVMFAWIGLRRSGKDWNKPYWEDGTSVGYKGWEKTQPTKPPKDEDYVIVSLKSKYKWKDGWHDS